LFTSLDEHFYKMTLLSNRLKVNLDFLLGKGYWQGIVIDKIYNIILNE
jgi:hypothetical protein